MAGSKKHAKGRLDKYYHMAKEQGYRARSAFKLIQLNKKYNFLEKAKCLVDLCAAPGGWLQVAAKYMPKPSIIIGLDLTPIKPIPNVLTFVEDITTEKCRSTLRSELKHFKVDVFLHDGAPNVGSSWLQDAFTQSELTLSALKLATQFLAPNGTFVTKVFRSKDYNKLLWVFHQLFGQVEATKPASSRTVSAEIFVVCQGFLAPKKIDPRLLDARFVFKELEEDEPVDEKKKRERNSQVLNDLLHPEKRRRHREGYADGDYTLHHAVSATKFIEGQEFVNVLSTSNQLLLDDEVILNHPLTTEEIKACCQDLKLLGRKDFKLLIKWREQLRLSLGHDQPKQPKPKEEEREQEIEEVMANEAQLLANRQKREKRKALERKAKTLIKLKLGMDTPMDIGLEAAEIGLHEPDFEFDESEAESFEDSDDEKTHRVDKMEQGLDQMYQHFRARQLERDPSAKVKEKKKGAAEFEEWYGVQYGTNDKESGEESNSDSSSSSSFDSSDDESAEPVQLSTKAKTFFSNPLFDTLTKTSNFEKEMTVQDSSDDEVDAMSVDEQPLKEEEDFEIMPQEQKEEQELGNFALNTATAYTLAQKLLTKSGKQKVIDDAYNRYAFNDGEGLPPWFMEDESKHNKPQLPVTKEAVQIMRDRFKALDARPIKKIAEAKYRKQLRTMRRVEKMKKKAEVIADDGDLADGQKAKDIQKLMAKASKKQQEKKPALVVAKGMRRGVKGRPKGVKGRYKMVDSRMKKELRAAKRKK